MSENRVTGSIQSKTTKKGNTYLYMVLTINGGSPKWEATGLQEKGNIKKAKDMLRQRINQLETALNEAEREKELLAKKSPAELIQFSDWMIQYIDSLKTTVRGSTFEGYQCRLNHIVEYYTKNPVTLSEVTTGNLSTFCEYLLTQGKLDKKTGERKPLAIRTVQAIKVLIYSALHIAVKREYIKYNPAASVKIGNKRNKELAKKFNFMQVHELNQLFKFMSEKNDPLLDAVKVLSHYGLRRSELLGITIGKNSLDLENRRLHISRTIVKVTKIHDEEATKTTSSYREFYIIDEMYELFQKIIAKKEENKKFYGNTYHDSEFLFTWEDGIPFNPDYLYHHFTNVMKEFGRPNFTLHNLRHSCASYLYECGWKEWDIANWLGHEDATTTKEWYAVLTKAHNDKQAKTLGGILNMSA